MSFEYMDRRTEPSENHQRQKNEMEERLLEGIETEHRELIQRIADVEHKVEDRVAGMTSHFVDELRDMRDFLMHEVRDTREFLRKVALTFAIPTASLLAGIYIWEWDQVSASKDRAVDTAQILATVVEQQKSLTRELDTLRRDHERAARQQDELNQLRILALRESIEAQHNIPPPAGYE